MSGPVTQETSIRQTIIPHGPGPIGMPGVTKRDMGCVQYLAQIFNGEVPNSAEFYVTLVRLGPAIVEGRKMPLGVIESRLPIAPYPDLYEMIRQMHGGGEYQIRVIDPHGSMQNQMRVVIDLLSNPPMFGGPEQMGRMLPGPGGRPVAYGYGQQFGAANHETDDVVQLRNEEARMRAEESKLLQEEKLEDRRRAIERKRQNEQDLELRKAQPPVEPAQTLRSELKDALKEMQQNTDRAIERSVASMKEFALLLKPHDNGNQTVEMIKAFVPVLTALLSKNNSSDMTEMMKMSNAATEKVMAMAVQNATTSSTRSETLLQQLIANKLEAPQTAVQQALDMRERGWKQAMEMFAMMEEARGGGGGGQGEVINPEGGFFGNLGNVILNGLNQLMSGGIRTGAAGKLLETVAGNLGKNPQQLTKSDMRYAADKMQQQYSPQLKPMQQPTLPAPQQQMALPAPVPITLPRVASPLGKLFNAVHEIQEDTVPLAPISPKVQPTVVAQPMPQMVSLPPQPVATAPVQPVVPTAPVVAQAAKVPPPEAQDDDDGPADYINQMLEIALEDVTAERNSHNWVDFALDKWPRALLNQVAKAASDDERLALFQQYADPALFQKFAQIVTDLSHPTRYTNFIDNLHQLVEEVANAGATAAAT